MINLIIVDSRSSLFSNLVVAICLLSFPVATISAQDSRDAAPQPVVKLSPYYTFFFSTPRRVAPSEQAGPLWRRMVRDNIEIPLDRIRFLADERIRTELNLSDKTEEELQPMFSMLTQFEKQDKWNFHNKSESVSLEAHRNIDRFIEKLKEIEERHLLTNSQLVRLEQMRLQFNCLGENASGSGHSPLKVFKRVLNLSDAQRDAIDEIIKGELRDSLRLETQFEAIGEVLTDDQRRDVDEIFGPMYPLDTPIGLSLAHCQPLIRFKEIEKNSSADFDLELVEGCVLTLSGRQVIESVYLEGADNIFVSTPWRGVLDLILGGGLDWLELTEEQHQDLASLKWLETREDGSKVLTYFGISLTHDWPDESWTSAQYKDWQQRMQKARLESDNRLGVQMQSILLPFQIESIRTGLAVRRTLELGPFHVLTNNVAKTIKLTSKQKKQITNLRDNRFSDLQSTFSKIDKLARRELAKDQSDLVERWIGDDCPLYPCVWFFL